MTDATAIHVILDRYLAQYQQARRRRALISGVLVLAIALTLAWRLQWGLKISAAVGVLGWAALIWGLRQGRISHGQAAEQLDRTLGLDQRLVTAEECLEGRKTSELYPALLADVEAKAISPTTGYPKPWSRTSSVLVALFALLLCWPYHGRLPLGLKPPQPPASSPPSRLPTPSMDQPQQQGPQSGAGSASNTNSSQNNNNQQPSSSSADASGASGQSSSSGQSQQSAPQNAQSSSQGQSSQGQASQSQNQGQNNQGQTSQQGQGQQNAGQQQGTQGQQGNSGPQQGAHGQQGAGQQSAGQQPSSSQSANAAGNGQQQSGAQQSSSPQAGTSQQGTPQRAGQPQAGQGDQQALKSEIQQLLKEMSGQVKELQGKLSDAEHDPPPPGTGTDPDSLLTDTTPLDPLTGAALPMQLQTDTAATKAQRRGGGTGKPSDEVGHESPEQQAQDAQLSATPTEQAAVTRQPVPPEYRPVFERLQSTESPQSEQTP